MNKKKFVVYTVMTGYKEDIRNPFPDNSVGYERICFTDNPKLQSQDWSIVLMDNHYLKPERESRRAKLLPHLFLADFDYSLYIDNIVEFKVDPLDILNQYINSESPFICFKHPWRDCIYEEAEGLIQIGMDDEYRIREQIDFYRSQGFPEHQGLIAGTVLLRKHLDTKLIELSEEWFNHVLRYGRRDQLSFNFVAWHRKFKYSLFDGSLTSNSIIDWLWLGQKGIIPRIPPGFNEEIYSWLNPEVEISQMSPREHYVKIGIYKNLPCGKYIWELERLANKYKTDKGSLYYNRHNYAPIYEKYLFHKKQSKINLLELGLLRHDVQNRNPGSPYNDVPSLKMWREYFRNAFIVGFDIADFSKCPPLENVKIVRGDMGKISDLSLTLQEIKGKFDIIIDDASHASHHQQIALGYLFDHLEEGGFYIIEDLHYQPTRLEDSEAIKTINILKCLEIGLLQESKFLPLETLRNIQENLEFIHFYDSQDRQFGTIYRDAIAIIKKKDSTSLSVLRNHLTENLKESLHLRHTNLIIFPDPNQSEQSIYQDLVTVITTLENHPHCGNITLLVNAGKFPAHLTQAFTEQLCEEEEEGLQISVVGKLSSLEWSALLPQVTARIVLAQEDGETMAQLPIDVLPSCEIDNLGEVMHKVVRREPGNKFPV
jgi:hypothetical protein